MNFTGGEKLQARLAELAEKVNAPGTLRVGFFENAVYPDGTPVAVVAAANEFGVASRGQPPRPFFRNMLADETPHLGEAVAASLRATDYDAAKTLEGIGDHLKGALSESISNLTDPPLKPETIKRKGFDKPLVDTNHMRQSIEAEVKS